MAFIVEMYHGEPNTSDFRCFSCHGTVWEELLKLAKDHGWKPLGTIPTKYSLTDWEKFGQFEANYEPEDIQYEKQILEKDAHNLADALDLIRKDVCNGKLKTGGPERPLLLKDEMDPVEYQRINAGITESFLTQLIDFLRKGGLSFSWDD